MSYTVLSGAFPMPHLFVDSVYLWFLWSALQPPKCASPMSVKAVCKVLELRFTFHSATGLCILVTRRDFYAT